jgi:hypothetical protein
MAQMVLTRSRVTPGVASTMLTMRREIQLRMELLPTLGRPTIATSGMPAGTSMTESSNDAIGEI